MQRPPEGCFAAYATPDEMAPHLPPGYWNGSCSVEAPSTAPPSTTPPTGTPLAAQARVPTCRQLPPVLRWWDDHRRPEGHDASLSGASTSLPPNLADLAALLAPFMTTSYRLNAKGRITRSQPTGEQGGDRLVELALGRAGGGLPPPPRRDPSAPPPPVLLLQAVPLHAVSQLPIVSKLASFDRELRRINGGTLQPKGGAPGLGAAWIRCLSMVRKNKCMAVC